MKLKIIITVICFVCCNVGFAQNKIFEKYADQDNITYVHISKAMFQMMPAMETTAGLNMGNMKGKIESLSVLSTENADRISDIKKDLSKINTNGYEELMKIKDSGVNTVFYALKEGEKIKDILMIVNSNKSVTLIQLLGNFTLSDIQKMTE